MAEALTYLHAVQLGSISQLSVIFTSQINGIYSIVAIEKKSQVWGV
jgi:hypothetical protein